MLTSGSLIPISAGSIRMPCINTSSAQFNNNKNTSMLLYSRDTRITNITHSHSTPSNISFSCPTEYQKHLTFDGYNFSRNKLKIKPRFKHPLYLYSFGGSGNTWTRVLFQYITGIATGSMYEDDTLQHLSVMEGHCNDQLLICKAHPLWFYQTVPPIVIDPNGFFAATKAVRHEADGMVWLIRDPWHAIWSVYQLRYGNHRNHANKISRSEWNPDAFYADIYMGIKEISLVEKWKIQFEMADILCKYSKRNWLDRSEGNDSASGYNNCKHRIVTVMYEHLTNKAQRNEEFMKILRHIYNLNNDDPYQEEQYFAYIDVNDNETMQLTKNNDVKKIRKKTTRQVHSSKKQMLKFVDYDGLLNRIECAFNYEDSNAKTFHRSHNKNNTQYVDIEYAYWSLGEQKICKIWHSLLPYAQPLGYKQLFLDKLDCESKEWFSDIVDIDNINNPNMTRFHEIFRRHGEQWKKNYDKTHSDVALNHSIKNWQFKWKSIDHLV